ncbi:MAG: hypothetical protein RIT37_1729 [Bacteroidota bacterium]|jgi:hypothetical protein
MVKNNMVRLIISCLSVSILLLNGCMEYLDSLLPPAPDSFEWRSGFFVRCLGQVLSPLGSVDIVYENGYVLKEDGKVAVSVPRITDFRLLMNASVLKGDGLRVILRKTVKGDSTLPGITFDYTQKGILIRDGERIIMQTDTIKAIQGVEELIKIDSEGKTIRIEIGCAKPCIFTTESLGTEFVITHSLPYSRVAVNGLEFLPMRLTRPSIR